MIGYVNLISSASPLQSVKVSTPKSQSSIETSYNLPMCCPFSKVIYSFFNNKLNISPVDIYILNPSNNPNKTPTTVNEDSCHESQVGY